jgi:Fic family protein
MDRDVFEHSPVGHLRRQTALRPGDREPTEFYAFIPDPLPHTVELPSSAYRAISDADHALGLLNGVIGRLPNPHVLIRPAAAREATATSALEGTYVKLFDVLAVDPRDGNPRSSDVLEVYNAALAAVRGFEELKTFPVHFKLAARLHQYIVAGTRGDGPGAGRVRDTQVFISGGDARDVTQARFVPPPPGPDLARALDDWEKWIHAEDDLPVIVKVALAHYQFETLHPFRDGNGRVGRLVMLLQLIEAGRIDYPVLNLSAYLAANGDRYRDLLLGVSRDGDFAPWVTFVADAIRVEALASVNRVDRLVGLQDQMRRQVKAAGVRGLAREVVEELIATPVVSASGLRARHNMSWPTANAAIKRLEDLGILSEVTGGKYGKVYVAGEVLAVLEDQ